MTVITRRYGGSALLVSLLAVGLIAAMAILASAALTPGTANAHEGHEGHVSDESSALTPVTAAEQARATRAVLPPTDVATTAKGLLKINTETGYKFTTHGPDFRAYDGSQPGFRPGDPERTPVCATDNYQRIIYAYPTGTLPADAATEIAEIRSIVRRMNYVLNADAYASGGVSADYKILCDGSGRIRVDTIAVPQFDVGSIIDSVRTVGSLLDNRADYTIFLDAPDAGWCGIGTYIADQSPGRDNPNNSGGGYAVIERGCWNTTAPMHENGHNQGAVQYGAPSSTGLGAHCAVDYDVMCYSPDGGDLRQSGTTLVCEDRIYFDCGYDDYFDTKPEAGEYLANKWNLGSPDNRFIRFTTPTGPPPEPVEGAPGLDEEPPKLVILQKPWRKIRARTRTKKVTFKFDAFEEGATYRCRVDRKAWRNCSSPHVVRVDRGRHSFRVRAIDGAGNRSPVKRLLFRLLGR